METQMKVDIHKLYDRINDSVKVIGLYNAIEKYNHSLLGIAFKDALIEMYGDNVVIADCIDVTIQYMFLNHHDNTIDELQDATSYVYNELMLQNGLYYAGFIRSDEKGCEKFTYGKVSLPKPDFDIPEFPLKLKFDKVKIDFAAVNNIKMVDNDTYYFNLISIPMVFNSITGLNFA